MSVIPSFPLVPLSALSELLQLLIEIKRSLFRKGWVHGWLIGSLAEISENIRLRNSSKMQRNDLFYHKETTGRKGLDAGLGGTETDWQKGRRARTLSNSLFSLAQVLTEWKKLGGMKVAAVKTLSWFMKVKRRMKSYKHLEDSEWCSTPYNQIRIGILVIKEGNMRPFFSFFNLTMPLIQHGWNVTQYCSYKIPSIHPWGISNLNGETQAFFSPQPPPRRTQKQPRAHQGPQLWLPDPSRYGPSCWLWTQRRMNLCNSFGLSPVGPSG